MKKINSAKKILADSFMELSAKKNVDKITVQKIVNHSGLTKTTFYNHFRDKYDLIIWIYAEPIKNIINRLDGENYTLRDGIFDVLKYFSDNRKFLLNAIKNTSGQNYFLNHVSQIHFNAFYGFIKSKSDCELPEKIEILSKVYCFGTVQTSCEWLINAMPIPIEEFTNFLYAGLPEELKKFFE